MFRLWKPQPQSQLFCDNINFRTSIQQHIFYCILPNLYLDNCHDYLLLQQLSLPLILKNQLVFMWLLFLNSEFSLVLAFAKDISLTQELF